jgi:hypothetical protein
MLLVTYTLYREVRGGRGEIYFSFKLIYHTLQPRLKFLEQRGVPFVIAVLLRKQEGVEG